MSVKVDIPTVSEKFKELRIAVVSTSLTEGTNDLWEAVRPYVGELLVIGPAQSRSINPTGTAGLAVVDFGKGAIWRYIRGLRRTLREFNPDLVHVNSELWGIPAVEASLLGYPFVVHGAENIWWHGGIVERWLRQALLRLVLARSKGYASWNRAGEEYIQNVKPRLPTAVWPAIIPPILFQQASWHGADRVDGVFDILLVGRLVRFKGVYQLLEAAQRLGEYGPVHISICGVGPELESLRDLAKRLRIDCTFLGHLSPQQLILQMVRVDCMVQPSISTSEVVEQFGRSVAEALTVGVPVLVSNSGELPEFMNGDERWVFPEGDIDALVTRLKALMLGGSETLLDASTVQSAYGERFNSESASRAVLAFWLKVLSS